MSTQLKLGQQISHNGKEWLVVRIVGHDAALFEDKAGNLYVREESYLQLKDAEGNIDFLNVLEEKKPFEEPLTGKIRPLEDVQWTTKKEEKKA